MKVLKIEPPTREEVSYPHIFYARAKEQIERRVAKMSFGILGAIFSQFKTASVFNVDPEIAVEVSRIDDGSEIQRRWVCAAIIGAIIEVAKDRHTREDALAAIE